jgi:TRAP-type C4-dicarboxylate transport system permease small subunit
MENLPLCGKLFSRGSVLLPEELGAKMNDSNDVSGNQNFLDRLCSFLARFAIEFCVVMVAADLIVIMLEVISRSAGSTMVWTEEISRWLLIWMTVIGGSVLLWERGHVRLEFFRSLFPESVKRIIDSLGGLAVLFFLFFFTVISWENALESMRVRGDIILIPLFYPKLSMVIGGLLMIVFQIDVIIHTFRKVIPHINPGGIK